MILFVFNRYILLLKQYEAVSYGDSLFASYVLIPLQQKHDLLLRKAVWGEHSGLLRVLMIPINQVIPPLTHAHTHKHTHCPHPHPHPRPQAHHPSSPPSSSTSK